MGNIKEFYIKLSDIIRIYLRDVLNVNAPDLTTPETLKQIVSDEGISRELLQLLSNILKTSDLVKFAKSTPTDRENDTLAGDAIQFVINTAPAHITVKNRKELL